MYVVLIDILDYCNCTCFVHDRHFHCSLQQRQNQGPLMAKPLLVRGFLLCSYTKRQGLKECCNSSKPCLSGYSTDIVEAICDDTTDVVILSHQELTTRSWRIGNGISCGTCLQTEPPSTNVT